MRLITLQYCGGFCHTLTWISHGCTCVSGLSVQFSRSVMSDSLQPHESQHTRPLCPSPTPEVYSNSCPSSWGCHPATSSSVVPFSSCHQSLPASGSFQISQLFTWGGQSIGVSASASVLPMNTQDWSALGWTDWISLQSKGLSRVFSNTQFKSINSLALSFLPNPLSHPYMTTGKTIALTRWTFVGKVMSLLFIMLSTLVITFLPRSKCLLISWLQPSSAVILEPPKIKSATVSTLSPSICHEVMGPDAMILVFWMLSFKPTFHSPLTFIKRLFSSSSFSAIQVVSSAYLRLLIFLLAVFIPACASPSPVFLMMYSACKLNKQGDNIQPCRTPFPIWNQSVVPCPVLAVASWPAYRFLKRQGRWSGIPSLSEFFAEERRLRWTRTIAAERSYPSPKVRGGCQDELPHTRGRGSSREEQPPPSKERRLHVCRRAERSYSTFKVRRGCREEIPLVQGKE